jgi:hypothetical protein
MAYGDFSQSPGECKSLAMVSEQTRDAHARCSPIFVFLSTSILHRHSGLVPWHDLLLHHALGHHDTLRAWVANDQLRYLDIYITELDSTTEHHY